MFLLVPAHPGCPGQIPQSRKTVVVVVGVTVNAFISSYGINLNTNAPSAWCLNTHVII